eukprot:TRINITY_DN3308_c0_g9_i1.p1 TRINITY_DN3308_c0_g9~~TRINITY_DN3308_c0_g9_i1.p1  ORF type:complete len:480 (+),score=136.88 TRINITY_DN3308_c0_g9_i1:61-1500(+)
MSDPFEVPAYQRQGFVESPVVSPRMAQQPTAQEMKLKEIVTALNEVATARKNEAEAIQQQLDKLAQDYERMRQDNEGLRAQLVPTAVATSSSTSTAAHELNRALQENDVLRARVADLEAQQYLQQQQLQQALQSQHMSSVAPASIPSLPASQPAPTSAPPVVHSTSTLPITTVPPLNRMKGALGGVVVNILLLCIAAMYLSSGTAEGARMPVALAVKGGLSHVVEHAVAVEDVLLNVTTEHFNENIEGGPVTLLGNLVEQGYTVNPPKSWRVMVAVAQGLDPDLDIARTRGSAKALVQGTCWECMETIEAGSFTTMFVVLLVTELILIVTAIFLKPSVLKAPVEVKLQEEALPAIMLPKGVSVHRTWVSPEDANCREVTLQFVAETALTSIVGKDLELCTFTVNTANGRVAGLSVDKKRIVNPASCQSLNGRPVLWLVNNAPPVLSEVNTCPAVEYTPASLATYQATRSDLDSASAGLF